MKLVPQGLSRFAHRSVLKLNASSPTLLVVGGVVGLGVTAVMAARATRKVDPVFELHAQNRRNIGESHLEKREEQKALTSLYFSTGIRLTKIYAPAITVGAISAASVLYGHNILRARHVATVVAYTGLQEQFSAYRKRIAKTLGEDAERDIYDGAHGEYVEDPEHKGEYKLVPKWDDDPEKAYLRPWFDETNYNWTKADYANYTFLKGVQNHMNYLLVANGHVFLNEALDALKMPRCSQGAVTGWVYTKDNSGVGDNYIDFGFMTSNDPHTIAFRNGAEKTVRLNFNIDGLIWDKI